VVTELKRLGVRVEQSLSKGAAGTEDEECDQGQFHCGYEAPGDKGAIAGPKYQGGNKGLEAVFESKCNILRTCGNWPWASGFCESVQGGVHPSTYLTHILTVVYFTVWPKKKKRAEAKIFFCGSLQSP
jgi:hypothetical protein